MRQPAIPPEFHTWSLTDGYELRGRVWRPRGASCRARGFIYLHGIQSHGGWFEWSASLLAESGDLVLLPDRRGSGLNRTARGDTPSTQRWLDDIDELADWARRECGAGRLGVVGVSWGGKLAAAWARHRPESVERLLLLAPGLFPTVDLGLLTKLRVGLALLRDAGTDFDIPLDDPALFTDNPAGRQFIADDPLKLSRVTARFLYCSRRLDRELARWAPGSLATPATLVLAGRDRIIRNAPTVAWLRRVAAETPDIRTHADSAHTLEFEPNVAQLAEVLRRWAAHGPAPGKNDCAGGLCNRRLPKRYKSI